MLSLIICNRNPLKWATVTAMYRNLLAPTRREPIARIIAEPKDEATARGLVSKMEALR